MLACRQLYGKLLPEVKIDKQNKYPDVTGVFDITRRGQVYYISNWKEIVTGKISNTNALTIINKIILNEMRSEMSLEFTSENGFKFNNIIMNPPYTNDMYLDFVTLAHKLATDNVVAITPAKWQAKGGAKNEQFRKDIVPYMSKIVYYMDESNVFMIKTAGGICYYLIDNSIHSGKKVFNKCDRVEKFNSEYDREYKLGDTLYNFGETIVDKLKNNNIKIGLYLSKYDKNKRYIVSGSNMAGYCNSRNKVYGWFSTDGDVQVTCKALIYDTNKNERNNSSVAYTVFSTYNINECESFNSYIDTKFVRFLVMIGFCTTGCFKDESWRFVPAPKAFDHIFTDQELYKEYDLTDEEIAIIESVIKERK